MFARAAVGVTFVYLAFFWNDPSWADPLFGLIVAPAGVTGLLALRARRAPRPLRAIGPLGHALSAAVFVPLFAHPATVGSALLFYAGSMLLAAGRRSSGCEVAAVSNTLLRRDDPVGCVLFAPVDLGESRVRRERRAPTGGA